MVLVALLFHAADARDDASSRRSSLGWVALA
jgi:hypothetical protein